MVWCVRGSKLRVARATTRRNAKPFLRKYMFDFFRIAVYTSSRDETQPGLPHTDAPDAAVVEPENQEDLDMLDINLGNKTLVIGVLIALILSYGMVNFDSGSASRTSEPAVKAALHQALSTETPQPTDNAAPVEVSAEVSPELASDLADLGLTAEKMVEIGLTAEELDQMSPHQIRRELRRHERM